MAAIPKSRMADIDSTQNVVESKMAALPKHAKSKMTAMYLGMCLYISELKV